MAANEQAILLKIRGEITDALRALDQTTERLDRLGRQGRKSAADLDSIARSSRFTAASFDLIRGAIAGISIERFVTSTVGAAKQAENSFKGLEAVANFAGIGIGRAFQEAEKLAADGLITVAEASKSLQNLLSRGYDIDQAVTTIQRLKDAAAFNRAAHLELGEAVVTATEGLKNENSILVDNAGVTKNVSVLWKEYAAQIGKSVDDLTVAEKIQAEYNGILLETEAQLGNAAKAAAGWQGEQARLNQELFAFQAQLGQALIPVLSDLARSGTFVIDNFLRPFITFVQDAGRGTAFLVQAIQNIGSGDFDALRRNYLLLLHERKMFEQQAANTPQSPTEGVDPAKRAAFEKRLTFVPPERPKKPKAPKSSVVDDARQATQALLDLRRAAIGTELADQQAGFDRGEAALKRQFDRNVIGYRTYYGRLAELRRADLDAQIEAKRQEIELANQSLANLPADQGRAAIDQARIQGDIERLASEIGRLEARKSDIVQEFQADIAGKDRELADQLDQFRLRLLEIQDQAKTDGIDLGNIVLPPESQLLFQQRLKVMENQYREFIAQLQASGNQEGVDLVRQVIRDEAVLDVKTKTDQMTQFAQRSAENMQDAFADLLFDPFQDDLSGMAKSFSDTLRRMAAEALSQDLLGALFGNQSGGAASSAGGLLSGFGDFSKGGGGIAGFFSNLLMAFGFDEGGWTGPGGRRQPAGVVHAGEYVFSAPSVNRFGVGFLEALHHLTKGPSVPSFGYANGGLVDRMAEASAGHAPTGSIRIINTVDPNLVHDYLSSPAGERVIVNHIQRNAGAIRQIIK